MNRIQRIRRVAATFTGLALAWLGLAAAAPAAFARLVPDPGAGYVAPASVPVQVQYRTVVVGGMPGWQIALIAVGAALIAAALAVLAYRTLAAHRKTAPTAA
jgi:hypothetical protein